MGTLSLFLNWVHLNNSFMQKVPCCYYKYVHYRFCSRFEKLKDDTSSIHVSHTVNNFEFFYEPFYVSLDIVPQFDERFVGYGFTRNTQVPN